MPRRLRGPRLGRGMLAPILAVALLVASASVLAEGPMAPQPMAGWTTVSLPMVASRYAAPAVTYSRFGVGAPRPYDVEEYSAQELGAGWYWDWAARPDAARPQGVEYYPTVRLRQVGETGFALRGTDEATIAATAAAHPGTVWFIGNEPDRKDWQDDLVPEAYAAAYAYLYDLIKTLDPTALIAAGQIVQPTPLRLEYLDRVLDAYYAAHGRAMPVDVWAIHAYPLREDEEDQMWGALIPPGLEATQGLLIEVEDTISIELFRSFLVDFRLWMATRGYQDRPLIVSEFGVLIPDNYAGFGAPEVVDYMNRAFDVLMNERDVDTGYPVDDYRLVQQWAWYRLSGRPGEGDGPYPLASWLYDAETHRLSAS
ncbi:MAG: hypothetical protein GX649_16370, partial [Chloroflexi bacterium]|nr:hypothetical protein [Chloroflexota bacterium]